MHTQGSINLLGKSGVKSGTSRDFSSSFQTQQNKQVIIKAVSVHNPLYFALHNHVIV